MVFQIKILNLINFIMSQSSKIFQKAPIQVPNRSGFDISHMNLLTMDVGTLTPVFTKLMMPNENISIGCTSTINLPPVATDFYGTIQVKYEAFFVPLRILYGGFEDMVTFSTDSAPVDGYKPNPYFPEINLNGSVNSNSLTKLGAGSLADYLGFKANYRNVEGLDLKIKNPTKFLAYHKIYDDWYRDSRIQKPVFTKQRAIPSPEYDVFAFNLPTFQPLNNQAPAKIDVRLFDGKSLFDLRQRNWVKDYFTAATLKPQAGDSVNLQFDIDSDNNTGQFSIRALRSVNAIQQWLERNNLVGNRYADQIFARTGVYPADSITDRAIYLGQNVQNIYNKSVYQTNNQSEPTTNNPFSSVGSKYASPMGLSDFSLVNDFHTTEHGIFMVIASIVPRPLYSTGISRDFSYQHIFDIPDALLQSVGDQEIYISELSTPSTYGVGDETTFGYSQRFSEHKFMLDEVHGRLKDGEDLSSFALQRSFTPDTGFQINSSFIQIPKNYLDQVSAVNQEVSKFGAYCEIGFSAKLVSTLAPYSIPTLGDPKDTHTEIADVGGKSIR